MNQKNENIKYFLYCRKSTEDKERQILSLESQEETMRKIAEQNGWKIVKTYHESKSAKAPDKRVDFKDMLKRIERGEARGIICWELSRLARNPDEAGRIMGMLQRKEIMHIKTYSKDYYSDDNAMLSFVEFGIANQYSRDVSKGVKRGIDKKAAMGWRPGLAPLGYLNTRTNLKGEQKIISDPIRLPLVKQIFQLMLTGNYPIQRLYEVANDEFGLRMPANKNRPERKLQLSKFYQIFNNTFYYGWYEWPSGSGNWVKGNHESIVTEEEFNQIQYLLGKKPKPRAKYRKFAFTGIMKCVCGAMITAEERYKKQKNGKVHHYIYYRCTRKIKPDCVEKYIELKELELQIDKHLSGLTISNKFKKWAVEYLHEVRRVEAESQEAGLESRGNCLMQVEKQINNLVMMFTSPDNAERIMLTQEEYRKTKTMLFKEQQELEDSIKAGGEEKRNWVELCEKTFNFALYAKEWFEHGDLDTKRAIFACLGSEFLLKDQKVAVTLQKPFQIIFERKDAAEKELERLEPLDWGSIKGKSAVFADEFPLTSG